MCGKAIPIMSGIICTNYGIKQGNRIKECNAAFHDSCYKQCYNDIFPVLKAKDLEDALVDDDVEEEDRDKIVSRLEGMEIT